jgi:hypothetical protein
MKRETSGADSARVNWHCQILAAIVLEPAPNVRQHKQNSQAGLGNEMLRLAPVGFIGPVGGNL